MADPQEKHTLPAIVCSMPAIWPYCWLHFHGLHGERQKEEGSGLTAKRKFLYDGFCRRTYFYGYDIIHQEHIYVSLCVLILLLTLACSRRVFVVAVGLPVCRSVGGFILIWTVPRPSVSIALLHSFLCLFGAVGEMGKPSLPMKRSAIEAFMYSLAPDRAIRGISWTIHSEC